ncbi:MAG: hypothetical protein AAB800_03390 [Patescibacteria group bacterium]
MITDADVEKLKKVFATKDDLKRFATKDDLKRFATKEDFKIMETELRGDIANDLKSMEARLRKNIVDDVADILQESVINLLSQHEERIDRLEKHVGGFPAIASAS